MLEHASGPSLHGDVTARGLTQGATARLGDLAPLRSILRRMAEGLSFQKIQSGGIRAVRQNQRIILRDARIPSAAWKVCRQSVQAAAPA